MYVYVCLYIFIFMHEKFFTEFYLIYLLTRGTSSDGIKKFYALFTGCS